MRFTFFILVALYAAVSSGLPKVVLRGAVIKCSREAKVPPATFEALLKTRKIPDTQQEKCFMGCLYKEIRLIKNGSLNYDLAKGLATLKYSKKPEQLKKALAILDICKSVKNPSDTCELGYKMRECFIVNSDEEFTPFLTETA